MAGVEIFRGMNASLLVNYVKKSDKVTKSCRFSQIFLRKKLPVVLTELFYQNFVENVKFNCSKVFCFCAHDSVSVRV